MKLLSLFVSLVAVVTTVFGAAPASAKHRRGHHGTRRTRVVRVYTVPRYRRTGNFARMYNRNYGRTRGLRYGRTYRPWAYRSPSWSNRRTISVWNGDAGRWHARRNSRAAGWGKHADKEWKKAEKQERKAEKREEKAEKHHGKH